MQGCTATCNDPSFHPVALLSQRYILCLKSLSGTCSHVKSRLDIPVIHDQKSAFSRRNPAEIILFSNTLPWLWKLGFSFTWDQRNLQKVSQMHVNTLTGNLIQTWPLIRCFCFWEELSDTFAKVIFVFWLFFNQSLVYCPKYNASVLLLFWRRQDGLTLNWGFRLIQQRVSPLLL